MEAEPSNPYDENAVQVWVSPKEIPEAQHEELAIHAAGFGHSLEQILDAESWMLGFVSKNENAELSRLLQSGHKANARLSFNEKGQPKVEIGIEEEQET